MTITRKDLRKDLEGYTVTVNDTDYRITFNEGTSNGRYAIRPVNCGNQYPSTNVATLVDAIDYLNAEAS